MVFIYGPIAVGKFTVAKELQKVTGYKVLHNHSILDLASELYDKRDIKWVSLRQLIKSNIVKFLSENGENFIMTHAYSNNYIFRNGVTNPGFVKKIEKIVSDAGGKFYPVYLTTSQSELLKRVSGESRKKQDKLSKVSELKTILQTEDIVTPVPFSNNLSIDNTKISPKKVAQMIKDHFKLG